ncbi:unnamed protein product [Somion occarium]|uniref:Amino acid transporter transmembrane domain-containing protein n=1 Tax=Somion occarium TaxID=3059160 RepID=A0ABP1CK07_9APHY
MSLPSNISFGSYSTSNVRDVINSYRRAQLYLADSVSASNSAASDEELENDIEQGFVVPDIDDDFVRTTRPREDGIDYDAVVGNMRWDEDISPGPPTTRQFLVPILDRRETSQSSATIKPLENPPVTLEARERTPLLRKRTSLSFQERPSYTQPLTGRLPPSPRPMPIARRSSQLSALSRISGASVVTAKQLPGGQSTFGQTLFNAIAILLGIGMLSEPLAFAYAGWIGGSLIIISYGFVTCYTGKILARIILSDPKLRSYSDIGRKAFGPRSAPWISAVFCLELFTIFGLFIFIPTMLLPLSILSYASIIGILSTLLIVVVMFIDGLSKKDAPGSLWNPADTSLGIEGVGALGLSFGLFMAGFSGHAVIPSLVRDMMDPSQFDKMLDYAFLAATFIYAVIGIAGYLMFGNSVSDEFSKDLMKIPGYNPILNRVALWGLVLAPLSKYALAARPLNITLEIFLGIDSGASAPDDHGLVTKTSDEGAPAVSTRSVVYKNIAMAIERVLFALASVGVSILVPEFSSMMAFLGAFSSFLLCVIGPILAKMALRGQVKWYDALVLAVAIVMATWGTGAAFWSTRE